MKWLDDGQLAHLRNVAAEPALDDLPYEIDEVLGAGGMGVVYCVRDRRLGRRIALKVLNNPAPRAEDRSRMLREARIIAALEHPGIVPLYDIGTLADGRSYYTMQFVQGRTMTDVLAEQIMPLAETLRLFLKIGEAVAFAHSRDVIHRDLKPANIMLGSFGAVFVMDWGIAKLLGHGRDDDTDGDDSKHSDGDHSFAGDDSDDHVPQLHTAALTAEARDAHSDLPARSDSSTSLPGEMLTKPGAVVGTPAFMAPEQRSGNPQAHSKQTDVFALGSLLFFMIGGKPPGPEAELRSLRSGERGNKGTRVPRPLQAIMRKAMHRDAGQRYADAGALTMDIERYLSNLPVTAYKENIIEKAFRLIARYRFVAFLLLAYVLVRIVMYYLTRL